MRKSELLRALQSEIRRHDFSTFVLDGITVPGCSSCRQRLNNMQNFIEHICAVLPPLLDKLSTQRTDSTS